MNITVTDAEAVKFWSKVDKKISPIGCWLWTGAVNKKGYGDFYLQRGKRIHVMAHRLSYEMSFGAIPHGLLACHRCDNPPCINPSHLFLGTHLDNVRDAVSKGRRQITLLDDSDIVAIRSSEVTCANLALEYGVSLSSIHKILNGKRRKESPSTKTSYGG